MGEYDDRSPEERQEDWAARLQPIYAVRDDSPTPQPATPPPHMRLRRRIPKRGWRKWVFWLLLLPLMACSGLLVIYVILPPSPLDVLILGLDARQGEGYVTRTDSIMLLGVRPRTLSLNLLSVPRDLFISVPNYGQHRVNTINVLGEQEREGYGPTLLAASFKASFDVQPDRYIRMNFSAFEQLVDAVGGLRIDVPRAIVDTQYPTENYGVMTIRFEAGMQHMDGKTALIYARTRHADDDYGRAARQQQVLSALAVRMANPLNWGALTWVFYQNVDTNLSPFDLALYAPPIMFGSPRIDRLVIDRDYILAGGQGAVPNYDKLAEWIQPRFD